MKTMRTNRRERLIAIKAQKTTTHAASRRATNCFYSRGLQRHAEKTTAAWRSGCKMTTVRANADARIMASRSRHLSPTILVTGFGPFPGAPFNPTMPLVGRLARLRRPALADIKIVPHIFPTSYAAVDRELPRLIAE